MFDCMALGLSLVFLVIDGILGRGLEHIWCSVLGVTSQMLSLHHNILSNH